MNLQDLISAMSSVGFPIVACIGLFYLYDKTIKEIINALNDVKSTLDNVNITLDKLSERLEKI